MQAKGGGCKPKVTRLSFTIEMTERDDGTSVNVDFKSEGSVSDGEMAYWLFDVSYGVRELGWRTHTYCECIESSPEATYEEVAEEVERRVRKYEATTVNRHWWGNLRRIR
jgi:hypothetical protein